MAENIEVRESAPWTECKACGLLDHPGMTCDEADRRVHTPTPPDVHEATRTPAGASCRR